MLTSDDVRSKCIATTTTARYKSYLNGIRKWIITTKANPSLYFNSTGELDLNIFTPDDFEQFLLFRQNNLKTNTLSGYRSAIKDLYRKNKLPLPKEYGEDMKIFFSGLKRIEADSIQRGSIKDSGKRPLPYSLYSRLCSTTLNLNDGGFSHLFLTSQWNLMCRSKSVETIHTSHFCFLDDSIGCILPKTKTNQDGSGPMDPLHIYANPFSPTTCWFTALAIYFACNPRQRAGQLLEGTNQKGRFCKIIERELKGETDAKRYGTHSIRKGVATFACSGCTGGPSIVSVCLRCGWSLGGIQDRYFRYEQAGDQFLGRVVAGLPINSSKFAALPPYFVATDDNGIANAIDNMFPLLANDISLLPILRLCLASLVYHADYFKSHLPEKHSLLYTYIFRDETTLNYLRDRVQIKPSPLMIPTGIPPHIELYKQQEDTKKAVDKLPSVLLEGFSQLLDEKGASSGNITKDLLEKLIKKLLIEVGVSANHCHTPPKSQNQNQNHMKHLHYWKGRYHFLPENFQLPCTDPLNAWRLWWFGNQSNGIPPLVQVSGHDMSSRHQANLLSEWSVFVRHMISAIENATTLPFPEIINEKHAIQLFELGVPYLPIITQNKSRRLTQLKVTTVLRLIRESIKKSNPNAVSMPFRHRKKRKHSN